MWFSLVIVIYTGLNPAVDAKPATVVNSEVMRGYQTLQECQDNLEHDAIAFTTTYGADYTVTGQCFQADPRLANFAFKPAY